jgi:Flp pilus assembly pilin Flp
LVADDSGEDLVEYGLLVGIFVTGLVALLNAMGPRLAAAFGAWADNAYNGWVPPDPTP